MNCAPFNFRTLSLVGMWLCLQVSAQAGADQLARLLAVDRKARIAHLESLTEGELLELANEAGWSKDANQLLPGIWRYGLGPCWDRKPLAPENHLSLIRDGNLAPAWRISLISTLERYSATWSILQIESAINEALVLLDREDLSGIEKVSISGLDRIIHAKWRSIDDDPKLTIEEKRRLVEKLHPLVAKTIISFSKNLANQPDADDSLLRSYAAALSSFGSVYLTQRESFTSKYKQGTAFEQTRRATRKVPEIFKKVLGSGKYPPQTVFEVVGDMAELNLKGDIPRNLVDIHKQSPKFTADDLDILAVMLQEIHVGSEGSDVEGELPK